MSTFIIHQNPALDDDKAFVFLAERFNWFAFLLPPVWALSHRLWWPLFAMIVAAGLLVAANMAFSMPIIMIYLLGCWWLALAASEIEGYFLLQRGWNEVASVAAKDLSNAEQLFFGQLQQRTINGDALK